MTKSFLQTAFSVVIGLILVGIAARYAEKTIGPSTTGDHAKLVAEAQDNVFEWAEQRIKFLEEEHAKEIADMEEKLVKCGCH